MKSSCVVALVLLAACALGAEGRRLPPPNCRPPPDKCIITIWSICAREEVGYQVRYRTFSNPCEMEEYNCIHGTRYRQKTNGPCRGVGAYRPGSRGDGGELGDEARDEARAEDAPAPSDEPAAASD